MSNDRPNVVMIIVHDIGQHLGCYGAGLDTPELDSMAERGVRFTNYHCTAAQCSPSRGSISTGKYPHRNGLVGLAHIGWEIDEAERKLPQILNDAGYETFLFGHQHESADSASLGYTNIMKSGNKARQSTECFIEHAAELAKLDKPFFASLGWVEPHRPYGVEGYDNDPPDAVTLLPWLPDKPGIREDIGGLNGLVYEVDRCVGEVAKCLEETGLAENTLFIFTTDHGIAMPRAKGTCFDPGTKTALIMHMPGRYEGGRVYDELLSNVDFLPAICELTGATPPDDIDGRSFLPLLDGKPYEEHDHIFTEMTYHDRYNPMRAIRTRRFKYIRNFGERPLVFLPKDIFDGLAGEEMKDEYYADQRPEEELFDLEADPLEMNDVAGDDAYADVLKELRGRVDTWMRETNDRLLDGEWPPSDKQRERAETDATPN